MDSFDKIWIRVNETYNKRGTLNPINNNCQHYCSYLLFGDHFSLQSSHLFQTMLLFAEFIEKVKESPTEENRKFKRFVKKMGVFPSTLGLTLFMKICIPDAIKEQVKLSQELSKEFPLGEKIRSPLATYVNGDQIFEYELSSDEEEKENETDENKLDSFGLETETKKAMVITFESPKKALYQPNKEGTKVDSSSS